MDPLYVTRLEPLIQIWIWCVGALVGSFLNVAVFRLPRRCLSVMKPARSFCPLCRHAIAWYENIPMLSWLALRARCSGCSQPIHWRYPLVELITMLFFGWLAYRDLSHGRFASFEAWGQFVVHASFGCALFVCSLIDFKFQIIPDEINIPGLLLAPVAVAVVPSVLHAPPFLTLPDVAGFASRLHDQLGSAFEWWGLEGVLSPLLQLAALPESAPVGYFHLTGFVASAGGAICGAGFIYLLGVGFTRILQQDAMGFGDVKYMALIGGVTGWQGVVTTLLVGCIAGSLGGLGHMFVSGRSSLTPADLSTDATPLGRMALWATGARLEGDRVRIRPGTSFLVRFATGDPYVPFGPFLSIGAFIAAFWPDFVPRGLAWWQGV